MMAASSCAKRFDRKSGVEDNRNHMNWLENDLQLESVEERAAMFRRYMGDDVQKWAKEHDRLRMLKTQTATAR